MDVKAKVTHTDEIVGVVRENEEGIPEALEALEAPEDSNDGMLNNMTVGATDLC